MLVDEFSRGISTLVRILVSSDTHKKVCVRVLERVIALVSSVGFCGERFATAL